MNTSNIFSDECTDFEHYEPQCAVDPGNVQTDPNNGRTITFADQTLTLIAVDSSRLERPFIVLNY